jgi:hypothetical protein
MVADGHYVWRIAQLPVAEGVLHERSMQLRQTKNGWTLDCTVRYAGIDGSHQHRVTLSALGPGIAAAPLDVTVGPKNRSYVLRVAGVLDAVVQLTQDDLRMEQMVYLARPPASGNVFYCSGTGQDTTVGGYLPATFMQDVGQ